MSVGERGIALEEDALVGLSSAFPSMSSEISSMDELLGEVGESLSLFWFGGIF